MGQKRKMNSEIARSNIDINIRMRLWAVSAGRCEICNKILYRDSKFGNEGNFAENAHIHAVSSGGPRHKKDMSADDINNIDNLMLLCAEHHHLIDNKPEEYTGDFLVTQKKEHEERIRCVTEIPKDMSCRMVTYFMNIDNLEIYSSERILRQAVISDKMFPRQESAIELHKGSSTEYISTKEYFEEKSLELEKQVKSWFDNIVKKEDAISIFALAPQPLLFKLGTLLSDQLNVHVFQCHRSDHKWAWPSDEYLSPQFVLRKTHECSAENIALVIDLSAEVIDSRIISVLSSECTIYHLTIDNPNRNFVKNKLIQNEFVTSFRNAMEQIKNEYPQAPCIRIFPAMPNSLAVRAGMDIMKSDKPVILYEQPKSAENFLETITIGGKNV